MKNLNSVMAAYLFVWAIFFVYFLTVARRIASLRDEVEQLKKLLEKGK
jgi:CcmD family protein